MKSDDGKVHRPAPADKDTTPLVPQSHMEPLDVLATKADAWNIANKSVINCGQRCEASMVREFRARSTVFMFQLAAIIALLVALLFTRCQ